MNKKFRNKKILITGGNGFLGRALLKKLKQLKCVKIFTPSRKKFNLLIDTDVQKMYAFYKPNIVFHLAAAAGGIGINKLNPGKFFYENIIINVNVIHNAYLNKVEKIISTGSVSSYPHNAKIPFNEDDIWNGFPEDTNSSYGIAKRMIHAQSLSYKKQYKFKSILLLLTNLYGPNDNFHPKSSHVVASLIKKFFLAKKKKLKLVEVWGDGSVTRDFCYVDDAADGIILAAKKYNKVDPLNIGSGKEISIKELAILIKKIVGYNGKIKWLKNKPTGPARRYLDISKAKKMINFRNKVNLQNGLKLTIDWFEKNQKNIRNKYI